MTPTALRLPLGSRRTRIEFQWPFDPAHVARPGFHPHDAVELWDVTNRQDRAAVGSAQRRIASPHFRPGVFAHEEDAVYQFVAMVACAHLGQPLGRGVVVASDAR
jgi:Rieske 2Fe-2S family protein